MKGNSANLSEAKVSEATHKQNLQLFIQARRIWKNIKGRKHCEKLKFLVGIKLIWINERASSKISHLVIKILFLWQNLLYFPEKLLFLDNFMRTIRFATKLEWLVTFMKIPDEAV